MNKLVTYFIKCLRSLTLPFSFECPHTELDYSSIFQFDIFFILTYWYNKYINKYTSQNRIAELYKSLKGKCML